MNNTRCRGITSRNTRCRRINNFVSEYCNQHYCIPEQSLECGICFESIDTPVKLPNCTHKYCKDCIYKWIVYNPTCPMCRAKVDNTTCDKALEYLLFIDYLIDIHFVQYSTNSLTQEELEVFNIYFNKFEYFIPYNTLTYYQITEELSIIKEIFNKIKINTEVKYFKSNSALKSIPGGVLYIFTN